jgi:hypothetical protein
MLGVMWPPGIIGKFNPILQKRHLRLLVGVFSRLVQATLDIAEL